MDIKFNDSEEWRVPDWRNAEEYEFANPKNDAPLINDQLRWEFLRRDKAYRESWNDMDLSRRVYGLIEPLNPTTPAKELNERSIFFIDSVMRGSLVSLSAPRIETSDEFIKAYGAHILELEQAGFLVIGFDPRFPVRPQIEQAQQILEHYREENLHNYGEDLEGSLAEGNEKREALLYLDDIIKRENTPEKPQTLLRVLDAHNEGISLQEIGQKIFFLTDDDAEGTSRARATAHQRLKTAQTCWQRISPNSRNVVL